MARAFARQLLVRHGAVPRGCELLIGRTPGVRLDSLGQAQAVSVARALAPRRLAAVYASPQARTRQTALAIADAQHLPVTPAPLLDAIDAGAWTGRPFEELDRDPAWRAYNARRSQGVCPGGESAGRLRERVHRALADLAGRHPGEIVAVVTHAEVIRAALLDALGWSLDRWAEIPVDPASVSELRWSEGAARIGSINCLDYSLLGVGSCQNRSPLRQSRYLRSLL